MSDNIRALGNASFANLNNNNDLLKKKKPGFLSKRSLSKKQEKGNLAKKAKPIPSKLDELKKKAKKFDPLDDKDFIQAKGFDENERSFLAKKEDDKKRMAENQKRREKIIKEVDSSVKSLIVIRDFALNLEFYSLHKKAFIALGVSGSLYDQILKFSRSIDDLIKRLNEDKKHAVHSLVAKSLKDKDPIGDQKLELDKIESRLKDYKKEAHHSVVQSKILMEVYRYLKESPSISPEAMKKVRLLLMFQCLNSTIKKPYIFDIAAKIFPDFSIPVGDLDVEEMTSAVQGLVYRFISELKSNMIYARANHSESEVRDKAVSTLDEMIRIMKEEEDKEFVDDFVHWVNLTKENIGELTERARRGNYDDISMRSLVFRKPKRVFADASTQADFTVEAKERGYIEEEASHSSVVLDGEHEVVDSFKAPHLEDFDHKKRGEEHFSVPERVEDTVFYENVFPKEDRGGLLINTFEDVLDFAEKNGKTAHITTKALGVKKDFVKAVVKNTNSVYSKVFHEFNFLEENANLMAIRFENSLKRILECENLSEAALLAKELRNKLIERDIDLFNGITANAKGDYAEYFDELWKLRISLRKVCIAELDDICYMAESKYYNLKDEMEEGGDKFKSLECPDKFVTAKAYKEEVLRSIKKGVKDRFERMRNKADFLVLEIKSRNMLRALSGIAVSERDVSSVKNALIKEIYAKRDDLVEKRDEMKKIISDGMSGFTEQELADKAKEAIKSLQDDFLRIFVQLQAVVEMERGELSILEKEKDMLSHLLPLPGESHESLPESKRITPYLCGHKEVVDFNKVFVSRLGQIVTRDIFVEMDLFHKESLSEYENIKALIRKEGQKSPILGYPKDELLDLLSIVRDYGNRYDSNFSDISKSLELMQREIDELLAKNRNKDISDLKNQKEIGKLMAIKKGILCCNDTFIRFLHDRHSRLSEIERLRDSANKLVFRDKNGKKKDEDFTKLRESIKSLDVFVDMYFKQQEEALSYWGIVREKCLDWANELGSFSVVDYSNVVDSKTISSLEDSENIARCHLLARGFIDSVKAIEDPSSKLGVKLREDYNRNLDKVTPSRFQPFSDESAERAYDTVRQKGEPAKTFHRALLALDGFISNVMSIKL